ncbi:MAG: hypothetical protein EOO56_05480 [Hymenobacter sp.]|nr:MAG: hypothetical protein EOO56_05480 [Hymenobacter sp.]
MGSFSATFYLETEQYPVLACVHEVHQDGNSKGEPTSKVYSDELLLTLEIRGSMLPLILWGHDQTKALPGYVLFHANDGLSPAVRLSFEDGMCVSYEEHFEANVTGQRAFYCQLSVVARRFVLGEVTFDNHWPVQVP